MLRFFCKGLSIFIIISIVIYSTVRLKQRHTIVDENDNVHQPMELKTVYRSEVSTSSLHYFHTFQKNELSVKNLENYIVKSVPGVTFRPKIEKIDKHRKLVRLFNEPVESEPLIYLLPDITDHATILTLAKMSFDVYSKIGSKDQWYDLDSNWGIVSCFLSFFMKE